MNDYTCKIDISKQVQINKETTDVFINQIIEDRKKMIYPITDSGKLICPYVDTFQNNRYRADFINFQY